VVGVGFAVMGGGAVVAGADVVAVGLAGVRAVVVGAVVLVVVAAVVVDGPTGVFVSLGSLPPHPATTSASAPPRRPGGSCLVLAPWGGESTGRP
jgi:hypothetical protein